jgi:hypothetical protein
MVLFDMDNRISGPYLATIHRILISVMIHGHGKESRRPGFLTQMVS